MKFSVVDRVVECLILSFIAIGIFLSYAVKLLVHVLFPLDAIIGCAVASPLALIAILVDVRNEKKFNKWLEDPVKY